MILDAFRWAMRSRPSSCEKGETDTGAPGVKEAAFLLTDPFQVPGLRNSVIPQQIEASINVTLMNLIPAVLFHSCPASRWH